MAFAIDFRCQFTQRFKTSKDFGHQEVQAARWSLAETTSGDPAWIAQSLITCGSFGFVPLALVSLRVVRVIREEQQSDGALGAFDGQS